MKRVLVTGGATGLGLGITQALVAGGYEVIVVSRRGTQVEGTISLVGDAREPGLIERVGPIDHLVNNAGTLVRGTVDSWTEEDFRAMWEIHALAPAMLGRDFARQGRPGSIVNIASTLAERAAIGAGAYAQAKAAMVMVTKSLALELAPRGIRANCLLVGAVPTAMTEGRTDKLEKLHLLGLGRPEDVGQAVRYLIEAPWVTGAALPVDGGLLTRG